MTDICSLEKKYIMIQAYKARRLFMIDFTEAMLRIKLVLSEQRKEEKIRDKDVAEALKLDPQYFAVIKRRKKIPYAHLAYFCKTFKVNLNWVLLEEKPQYL